MIRFVLYLSTAIFLVSSQQAVANEHGKMIIAEDSIKWRKGVSGIAGSIIQTQAMFTCDDYKGGKSQCNKIHALDIREATDDVVRCCGTVDILI